MKKIFIVGSGGSGKTTLAAKLSEKTSTASYQLDTMFWEDSGKMASPEVFKQRVDEVLENDAWIIDGNYRGPVFDAVSEGADTVIWLNIPFHMAIWRSFKRSIQVLIKNENLYGTLMKPTIWGSIKAIVFISATFHERNRFLKMRLNKLSGVGKDVIELNSDQEINRFLHDC